VNWDDLDDSDFWESGARAEASLYAEPEAADRPDPRDLAEYGDQWRAAVQRKRAAEWERLARAQEETA
jgi:hypothetical protein